MDLIYRYLATIGALLPQAQRQDITAELRDALMTRCEDKEAETGRSLTENEVADLLRGFGHPLVVATRYGGQHYLIGPELYPLYVFILKILLAIVAVAAVVTGVVTAAVHPEQPGAAIGAAFGALIKGAIGDVGALTILAAVLERQKGLPRFLTDWSPRDLPKPLRRPLFRPQTRFDNVSGIIAQSVFILWWTHALAIWTPNVSHIPLKVGQGLDLARAPIWDTLFWPVLGPVAGHHRRPRLEAFRQNLQDGRPRAGFRPQSRHPDRSLGGLARRPLGRGFRPRPRPRCVRQGRLWREPRPADHAGRARRRRRRPGRL